MYKRQRNGQSLITIEFDLKTDIDVALQDVQSKISQTQYELPKDIDPPIINKFNPDDQPFMWISLSSDCLLYTSDAADERSSVDLGGRRIIKKKTTKKHKKKKKRKDQKSRRRPSIDSHDRNSDQLMRHKHREG